MKHITRFALAIFAMIALSGCEKNEKGADAWGNFEVDETTVSAQALGEILDLKIEEGMVLKANEKVGQIDTMDLHLQKMELLANRKVIETQSRNVVAQYDVAKKELDNLMREQQRIEELLASNAATQKQLDDINGMITVTKSRQNVISSSNPSISAQLGALDAKMDQIDRLIDKASIINPINGTVITQLAQPREVIAPSRPLYTIADLTEMNLRVYVSGAQLPNVKLGQQVRVFIDKDETSNQELAGTVSWIATEAEFTPKNIQTKEERVGQVYAVKIKVKNDGRIKSGMPAEVLFQ